MTAGTHIAGAVLTAAILRGAGVEIGFPEALVCLVGSLLADIDTTTSGVGKFARPLSSWIETSYGHRTVTHSLLFCTVLGLALYPLMVWQPAAYWAFLWGYLSHLLLDTFNVNGVPLLWPARVQFWFFPARALRIKYASPAESLVAVICLMLGLGLWFIGADGFDTSFRRLVASPETAVIDYLKMRDDHDVYAELSGFNSQTQEDMEGRYLIVEALGRNGVLVEDSSGKSYAVSKFGQVVAYRIRAYSGDKIQKGEYRVDISGRTVGELLASLPKAKRVHITGTLELGGSVVLVPAPVGTTARVRKAAQQNSIELQAARPDDLVPLERLFITSGSAVVRAEFVPGVVVPAWTTQTPKAKHKPHSITIPNLPSAAGLLIRRGDSITAGQIIARYVNDAQLVQLERQAQQKRQTAKDARGAARANEKSFRAERSRLERLISTSRQKIKTLEFLVAQDAEPRVKLQDARAAIQILEESQTRLILDYSSQQTAQENRALALEVEAANLETQRNTAQSKQLVKSPFSGEVADIRMGAATQNGVSVEVVLISQEP